MKGVLESKDAASIRRFGQATEEHANGAIADSELGQGSHSLPPMSRTKGQPIPTQYIESSKTSLRRRASREQRPDIPLGYHDRDSFEVVGRSFLPFRGKSFFPNGQARVWQSPQGHKDPTIVLSSVFFLSLPHV